VASAKAAQMEVGGSGHECSQSEAGSSSNRVGEESDLVGAIGLQGLGTSNTERESSENEKLDKNPLRQRSKGPCGEFLA
jgi:hypothetical protein